MKLLLTLFSVFLLVNSVHAQSEPEEGSTAETDTKASWSFEPDPALPNVMILGDSISIGYTLKVRELLKGKANVYRPMSRNNKRRVNCNGTILGVRKLGAWLAPVDPLDVIHFNWGLHDLKHVVTAGTNDKSNDPNSPTQATLEEYTQNMTDIVQQLKETNARLIFATTTPVVDNTLNPLRFPKDVVAYNKAAVGVMEANDIPINDLHAYCLPNLGEWQLPRNCHFRPLGSQKLAEKVAEAILEQLKK